MTGFEPALRDDELWEGELCGVDVRGAPVLLVRCAGQVHAYRDRCRHLGVKLSEGSLEGAVLTCRAHHWQYDVASGESLNPRGHPLVRLPVRVSDGAISVALEGGDHG